MHCYKYNQRLLLTLARGAWSELMVLPTKTTRWLPTSREIHSPDNQASSIAALACICLHLLLQGEEEEAQLRFDGCFTPPCCPQWCPPLCGLLAAILFLPPERGLRKGGNNHPPPPILSLLPPSIPAAVGAHKRQAGGKSTVSRQSD